jgi:hypothetical protein
MPDNDTQQPFPTKHMKKIQDLPDFVDGINAMDTEEIKGKILQSDQHLYEIEIAKDKDGELAAAKEKAKECAAPYRESKGIETAKIQYCLYVLESRGVSLSR